MSFLIANHYLTATAACGGGPSPRPAGKPAADESEPPIRVDEPGTEPPAEEEDKDWNKKGGPGAGGGYFSPPVDSVVLSGAARARVKE